MKIGFFGGSFNPPTFAHINLAKKAIQEGNLDKVIFVPIGDFYNKKNLAPAKDRYNMLKIACDGINNLDVSDLELNAKEKMYAVDAFELIQKNYKDDEVFFIMGADNFVKIGDWKNSEKLINKFKYIVLDRENIDVEEYINKQSIDITKVITIENKEYNNCSSSTFRENQSDDKKIVDDEVKKYIEYNNLFQ